MFADTADDAEAAFYEAVCAGDVARLMALWADEDDILCVHPAGGRLVGASAIRASFEAVLADGGLPIVPEAVHRMQREHVAVHHLVERVTVQTAQGRGELRMLATNVYVKTPAGWRIAVHHATAAGADDSADTEPAPQTLH